METNLGIYQVALTYVVMALFVGIGAAIATPSSFIGIIGYVLIAIGVGICLTAILNMNPFLKNKVKEEAADFVDDWE